MEKAQAREEIQRRLDRLSPQQRRDASARIRQRLAELPEWQAADTVLLFLSMPDEVDTLPIVRDALAAGKTVAVPKVHLQRKTMDACRLRALRPPPRPDAPRGDGAPGRSASLPGPTQSVEDARSHAERGNEGSLDLVPGVFGILEPRETEVVDPSAIDLVLVPARGFDRAGNRLGRGGGYYDRYMAQQGFRAVRCGIAFAAQLLDDLPRDPHDLPVHLLVTEAETLRFGKGG